MLNLVGLDQAFGARGTTALQRVQAFVKGYSSGLGSCCRRIAGPRRLLACPISTRPSSPSPPARLAGAALERASELGAEPRRLPAGTHPRRPRSSLRDARLDSSSDREDVGLAVRVVHDGAWGFASGIVRTAARRPTWPSRRWPRRRSAGCSAPRRSSSPPSRSTPTPPGSRPTTSTRSTFRSRPHRAGWPSCPSGCSPPTASTTSTRSVVSGAGEQVLRRHPRARSPRSSGCASHRSSPRVHVDRGGGLVLLDAHARAAGRARLGVPHRHRLGLRRRDRRAARAAARARQGAERRGRRRTTW